MEEVKKNKKKEKNKESDYTVIRKFDNKGESFQKIMEKLLLQKMNEI